MNSEEEYDTILGFYYEIHGQAGYAHTNNALVYKNLSWLFQIEW